MNEIFLKKDGVFYPTSVTELEALHDALPWGDDGYKKPVVYYQRSEMGHLIEMHFRCSTSTSPDGCTYCAAGMSKCGACGVADYDDDQKAIMKPCVLS